MEFIKLGSFLFVDTLFVIKCPLLVGLLFEPWSYKIPHSTILQIFPPPHLPPQLFLLNINYFPSMQLSLSLMAVAIAGVQAYPAFQQRANDIAASSVEERQVFEFPDNFGGE